MHVCCKEEKENILKTKTKAVLKKRKEAALKKRTKGRKAVHDADHDAAHQAQRTMTNATIPQNPKADVQKTKEATHNDTELHKHETQE